MSTTFDTSESPSDVSQMCIRDRDKFDGTEKIEEEEENVYIARHAKKDEAVSYTHLVRRQEPCRSRCHNNGKVF